MTTGRKMDVRPLLILNPQSFHQHQIPRKKTFPNDDPCNPYADVAVQKLTSTRSFTGYDISSPFQRKISCIALDDTAPDSYTSYATPGNLLSNGKPHDRYTGNTDLPKKHVKLSNMASPPLPLVSARRSELFQSPSLKHGKNLYWTQVDPLKRHCHYLCKCMND